MPVSVMVVVLIAAILHASWNFLIKQQGDKHVSMTAVVLGHLPYAMVALLISPLPTLDSLIYAIVGALLHTGYQLFLLYSYKVGDLSHVYPLARGVSPLIVAVISVGYLEIRLDSIELTAIAIISCGIMSLSFSRRSDGLRNVKAAVLAVITGVFIASYSLVDGMGARIASTAFGFYGVLSIFNAAFFSISMAVIKPGTVTTTLKQHGRLALFGGGASFSAYALVIWAFTKAPIAMVTALRETSIIFALLLGVFVLKERLDLTKVLASMATLIGAGLLRIKR
ncbi:DMT family transporter [Desulforhopalus sp. 52FAK]